MALHPKLAPFADRKYIGKLSRALRALEKDMASLHVGEFSVDLCEEKDGRSFMDKFLALRTEYHMDRVLQVEARLMERDVRVWVPMHQHQLFPYWVEIELMVPIAGLAAYDQGFVKKHWVTEPKNEPLEQALQALRLPKIKWVYSDRGLKHKIRRAFVIGQREDESRAVWCIQSGYFPASFFGGNLPKVSSFVTAVPQLEAVLASHGH